MMKMSPKRMPGPNPGEDEDDDHDQRAMIMLIIMMMMVIMIKISSKIIKILPKIMKISPKMIKISPIRMPGPNPGESGSYYCDGNFINNQWSLLLYFFYLFSFVHFLFYLPLLKSY